MEWFLVALGAFFFISAVNLYDEIPRTRRKDKIIVIPLTVITLFLGFGMLGLAILVNTG